MAENRNYLLGIREDLEKYYNGFENEEGEQMSLYDYISEEVLDYEITINSQMEFSSCKLWVTLGGPNVWIDTADQEIKLAWGTERDSIWLPSEICEEINAIYEEFYNCR